jgi:hypothetical protein
MIKIVSVNISIGGLHISKTRLARRIPDDSSSHPAENFKVVRSRRGIEPRPPPRFWQGYRQAAWAYD